MDIADYLVGPTNREALAFVQAWPDWPAPTVMLVGPPGSGKTHLAEIWRATSSARMVAAASLADVAIDDLLATGAVAVEDLDRDPLHESALFHLINRVREAGAHLLLTSRRGPDELAADLPDLTSRLRSAPRIDIGPPDDSLLRSVFAKLFADRQLEVGPEVVEYLIRRIDRSLDMARQLVSELDRRALSEGRAVTRPLAAAVLSDLETASH